MKNIILMSLIGQLLIGCGANYKVKKVASGLKEYNEPGIYYALPKTEVFIVIPVDQKYSTFGLYAYDLEKSIRECNKDPNFVPSKLTKSEFSQPKFGDVQVFTRAVADNNHRYLLELDVGRFATYSHTVELDEKGVMTAATTTASDPTAALIQSSIQAALDIAKAVDAVPGIPASIWDCPTLLKLIVAQNKLDANLKPILDTRRQLILNLGLEAKSENLEKALALLKAEETKIRSKPEYAKVQKDLAAKKSEMKLAIIGKLVPSANMALSEMVDLSKQEWKLIARPDAIENEKITLANINDTKLPTLKPGMDCISHLARGISVDIDGQNTVPDNVPSSKEKGYRYRIPIATTIKVSQTKAGIFTNRHNEVKQTCKGDVPTILTVLQEGEVVIAQHGTLASLPASVKGAKLDLSLALFSTTGALKKATFGSTGQSPSSITNITGLAASTIEAKRNEDDDSELNSLRKRKEKLELEKAIKELEEQQKEPNT